MIQGGAPRHARLGWNFIFLAANQDAILAGASIGINHENSVNFAATGPGIAAAGKIISGSVSQIRIIPNRSNTPPPK